MPTEDTDLRSATWFEPRFVVEVFYRGIGGSNCCAKPPLKAVRADKEVNDLADSDRAAPAKPARGKRVSAASSAGGPPPRRTRAPKLSSPSKVLFPGDGYTKQDVWDYYWRSWTTCCPR